MIRVKIVLTDSGESRERVPFGVRPVLVVRDVTEQGEIVDLGTVKLVGTNRQRIIEETERVLNGLNEYIRMADKRNPCAHHTAHGGTRKKVLRVPCGDPL
jgi:UDP-N-acetylglucosamine 2-epimerase